MMQGVLAEFRARGIDHDAALMIPKRVQTARIPIYRAGHQLA